MCMGHLRQQKLEELVLFHWTKIHQHSVLLVFPLMHKSQKRLRMSIKYEKRCVVVIKWSCLLYSPTASKALACERVFRKIVRAQYWLDLVPCAQLRRPWYGAADCYVGCSDISLT